MSNILILGGDGYLGWPTAMYFSAKGNEVTVVDNYFRRHVCDDIDVASLYSLPNLVERSKIWHEKTGHEIKVVIGDLADPSVMRALFTGGVEYQWCINKAFSGIPDTVIHFAEQPSAPYSLMNYKTANFTLTNNLLVTNNLMFAVRDYAPDVHIVKLGTMGEYGTPNIDIEEGWLEIDHNGRSDKFLFPRQAGSLYHTTKIMDTDLLWFGVRMWDLRVTDLMQGPVYGIETDESNIDERLKTIFNYDDVFGTVVNRFLVQAVAGVPLTVYGKGGQTRGYLNIRDTLQCVGLATGNPVKKGKLRILNQFTEQFTVNELAEKVERVGNKLGMGVKIRSIENPRKEAEEHYYNAAHSGLKDLGLKPHFMTDEAVNRLLKQVKKSHKNIDIEKIMPKIGWASCGK